MTITFTVPAVPVAQPRPRATTVNGQARMYAAKKSHAIHDFKASVRHAWAETKMLAFEGPLVMKLRFVFPRNPKWQKRQPGRHPKPTKPDMDNLAKGVCDSLNELAYHDDAAIVRMEIEKHIAAIGEQPHVEITIEAIEAERLF